MAGVRKINDDPLRYLVTHTHMIQLDDCEMRVVERVPTSFGHYFLCLKHQLTDCKCVSAVMSALATGGVQDED